MDPVFVQGLIATVLSFAVFVGTPWLLLAMVLGPRMAYLVLGSVFFGIMVILSAMWFANALGPKGTETRWQAIGVGNDLTEVEGLGSTYEVGDYPEGGWLVPQKDHRLADLRPQTKPCLSLFNEAFRGKPCAAQDTLKESANAQPVMTTLVSEAISPIPGKRDKVKVEVHGTVSLPSGTKFTVIDIRMKEAIVDGKPSILAMGRAVASDSLIAETLGGGVSEAKVTRYLVKIGDSVRPGQAVLEAEADSQTVTVPATASGRVIALGLRVGDKVKPNVPVATIDLTGQPGVPPPAEVSAVRVRGAVRTPAFFYVVASLILFAIHMAALSRAERAKRTVAQPA